WKEYDACAPSGCLRVQGILLGGSPRTLRLQTVFRILNSARSCRIRVQCTGVYARNIQQTSQGNPAYDCSRRDLRWAAKGRLPEPARVRLPGRCQTTIDAWRTHHRDGRDSSPGDLT